MEGTRERQRERGREREREIDTSSPHGQADIDAMEEMLAPLCPKRTIGAWSAWHMFLHQSTYIELHR